MSLFAVCAASAGLLLGFFPRPALCVGLVLLNTAQTRDSRVFELGIDTPFA
jgi:hypothetical protein